MAVSSRRRILETRAGTAGSSPVMRLAVVVGYDGSEPARHALGPGGRSAVATDPHGRYGNTAEVVIVVGGSAHRYHHLAGSVGSSVVRSDRFPVMVV